MTDLYKFAGSKYNFGLTSCAPIVRYNATNKTEIEEFIAALCID